MNTKFSIETLRVKLIISCFSGCLHFQEIVFNGSNIKKKKSKNRLFLTTSILKII